MSYWLFLGYRCRKYDICILNPKLGVSFSSILFKVTKDSVLIMGHGSLGTLVQVYDVF